MVDVEKLSEIAMEIITYAGQAKSNYLLALKDLKNHSDKEAREKIKEGSEVFSQAHTAHTSLLNKEMNDNEPQVTLLLVHAENQLMQAETVKLMVEEFADIYNERSNFDEHSL